MNDEQIKQQEEQTDKVAMTHMKPYLDQTKQDIDKGSLNFVTDLTSLEKVVMSHDVGLSYQVFQNIRDYAVKKYPNTNVMPQSIMDGLDSLILWQITAIPKATYSRQLPERYVDLCMNIIPSYNKFFHGLGESATFHHLDTDASMEDKRNLIKKFLKYVDQNYSQLVNDLNMNAEHSKQK